METKEIEIKLLQTNNGQVDGLPKNPRQIKDGRYELLKKSITDAPEMLKLRELLVYPIDGGKFVVIGGNMRLRACKELGYKTLPCKVLDVATPPLKLREYAIFAAVSVLDLFGGTGTTLIAAEQLKKQCFMMELSAKECDIIIARWEKLTNGKAARIAQSQTV